MPAQTSLTRDISYASSARTRGARALIRVLENATGRLSLIRRAAGYEAEIARGRSFWQVLPERYGLRLDVTAGSLADIPTEGPLVVIANHPFGILDGLMMGHLLDTLRGDFRILANAVFRKAPDLDRVLLPISFDPGADAVARNIETRARTLAWLRAGGAVGVFPGGTVSTAARPFGRPFDPGWRRFTARMIAKSGATVVPIFFEGHNSRLFQIASHLHYSLRLGLLIKEFRTRVDAPVRIAVGAPIGPEALVHLYHDPAAMMAHLRRITYALSPALPEGAPLGYEFEESHRDRALSRHGADMIG
jgi:putative hemolysin